MSSVDLKYFYVRRHTDIYGPATANQLIRAAREGAVRPTDEIAVNPEGPWRPASTCVELRFCKPSLPPDDEDHAETLFVWDGYHRRGPISLAQLRLLLDWDQIALDSKVSDVDGRMTTAGVVLKLVEEPPPAIAETTSEPPDPPAEKPPAAPPRKKQKQSRPSFPDLEVLVRMEREAEPVAQPGAERKAPEEQQVQPEELLSRRSLRQVVHSETFHLAYRILAVFISIEAAAYLAGQCSLSGVYLSRLSALSLEVFIPFESAPERLEGNDLMLAGVGLTCIFGELLLPLILLYKADLDSLLYLVAGLAGLLLSHALEIEQLAACGAVVRWVLVICGIATAGIGLWIISQNANGRLLGFGLTAVMVTACSAGLLTFAGSSEVLEVQPEQLPPTLRGSGLSSVLVALGLLGLWLPLPLLCLWMISSQTDETTREYMKGYFVKGIVLGTFGLLSLGFLIAQPDIRFASLPLNLLPFVSGALMCSFLQSLLWYLQPSYSTRQITGA